MYWRDTWGGEDLLDPQRGAAIDACFRDAYEAAKPGSLEQKRIISAFVSHFSLLAFRPRSWFYNLWLEWRLNYTKDQKLLLKAVERGISRRIVAYSHGDGFLYQCASSSLHDQRMRQAYRALENLRADRKLEAAFQCYRKAKKGTARGNADWYLDRAMARIVEVAGLTAGKLEQVSQKKGAPAGHGSWRKVPHPEHQPLIQRVRRLVAKNQCELGLRLLVQQLYRVQDHDLRPSRVS